MSDIQKFTGYLSSDGKTHKTQKLAIAHELELKIRKALDDAFGTCNVYGAGVETQPLDGFLYENRGALLAALNQEVLLRKKRGPNKPKATEAAAPAA